MIYKQPSGNAGEYYPAFFEMRLKVDSMIDLNTCSDSDFALFFHEYVHFLQDLMTTYGLTNGSPAKACGNRNTIKLQVVRFNKQKAY